MPVGVPAGAFFPQKVNFLILGVFLCQRNENIGPTWTPGPPWGTLKRARWAWVPHRGEVGLTKPLDPCAPFYIYIYIYIYMNNPA